MNKRRKKMKAIKLITICFFLFANVAFADAVDDTFNIDQNSILQENVLTNDSGIIKIVTYASNPSCGNLTMYYNGDFEFDPTGCSNTATFTYEMAWCSSFSGRRCRSWSTDTANVNILISSSLSATNDEFTTPPDNPLYGNILDNDIGENIEVISFSQPTSGGSLTVQSNGDFVYNPPLGFIGTDTFTYTITDANNETDSATVTINVEIQITEGVQMPFYLINSYESRNVIGDYKLAGNTVLCITDKTSGYGGNCQGDLNESIYYTSNNYVTKYLDIDNDSTTWNSTSSYIEVPNSYDSEKGVIWAGLFWQGRISVDKDYDIRYAKEGETGFDYIEVGRGTSITINQLNIIDTGAMDIKLKINSNGYSDVTADTFHIYESSNGQTYAAFANVTSLFTPDSLAPGKNTFTVANLTTMEGREPSPGAFGGWSLVVIYAEKYEEGSPKNISIYNGFISINENNDPIEISGFRLPKTGPISAHLSVFSGEGEYLYGRTDRNNAEDWMKISDNETSGYDYMPGLADGDGLGNKNNMFDAQLQNILRDKTVNGVENSFSKNNTGVDVDFYDISELMESYRDSNPLIDRVYIQMYSNNDYITPSMMAFSTELYQPSICYDYTFDIDGYVLDSSQNDVNTTLHLAMQNKPLRTRLLVRSLEGDFVLENAEFSAKVIDDSMLSFKPGSVKVASNINEYEDAGDKVHNADSSGFSLYFGNDAAADRGGYLDSHESHYILFDYETNTSKPRLDTSFLFDVNFTVNYGSGPVSIYRQLNASNRCPTSTVYAPEWGIFNVISDIDNPTTYNLTTQVVNRNFNVFGVFYDTDLQTPKSVDTKVEVEVINANLFQSDTNASCNNPDSNISQPLYIEFNNSPFTSAIEQIPQNAMRNSAFRIWYLENNKNQLVITNCASIEDEQCFKNIYDTNFTFDIEGEKLCQSACDGNQAPGSCYRCLKKEFGKPICSRDNFSIRPEAFIIDFHDINQITMVAEQSPFFRNDSGAQMPIAAGYDYQASIIAKRFGDDNPSPRYVQSFSENNNAGPIEENSTVIALISNFRKGLVCDTDSNRTFGSQGAGGNLVANVRYQNVGDFIFMTRDSTWTAVDNPGIWGQDCIPFPNEGYDKVPNSGMVGCLITSDYNSTINDINVSIRPYSFDLSSLNIATKNPNFVYMNDLRTNKDMSILISGLVRAVGGDNTILTNFAKGCYAKDTNLTFTRSLNPAESTLSAPSLLRLYDLRTNRSYTTVENNVTTISATQFNKGKANAQLAVNIDKNSTRAINPIELNITSIDIKCSTFSDCNTFSNLENTHEANGTRRFEPNPFRRFIYYGRLHAPDYRTEENSIDTPIYAEVYCDSILVNCADFNISRENGWRESVDEFNWWINPLHGNGDGNITSLSATTTGTVPNNSIKINNLLQSDDIGRTLSNGSYSPTIEYTGEIKPHKTRINISTQPWLLYNRFFTDGRVYYDVTFEGQAGNWGGIGTLGQTVDTNASGSSSRRIEW